MKNNYNVKYNEIRKIKLLHITISPHKSKNKHKKTPLIAKCTLKREQIRRFMKKIRGFQSLKKKIRGFMKNRVYEEVNSWPSKLVQEKESK